MLGLQDSTSTGGFHNGMADKLEWTLRHASIVLVSERPLDARSVESDTLTRGSVVPQDWTVTNRMSLQVIASTEYDNGASIRLEGNKCVFQQNVDDDFWDEYPAFVIAKKYAEASRLTSYSALGINWNLESKMSAPGEWFTSKLSTDFMLAPGFQPTSIRMARSQGRAVCNLNFNLESEAIVLDCNYHIALGNGIPENEIDLWDRYQIHLKETVLPTILG